MMLSRWLIVVAGLVGCAGGSNPGGQTGGAGGQAGSGGAGGGGTGGTGGGGGTGGSAPDNLPAYSTTFARGKIAGKTFEFVTGFVRAVASDASAMSVELLGFSPELNGPCWNKPPAGSNRDLELRVIFTVPRSGGSFLWGGGQNIAGYSNITLGSVKTDGTNQTQATDKAKVMIGAWPATSSGEATGAVVVQADTDNAVNGTFTVRRCE
jgi:hypothetical protein